MTERLKPGPATDARVAVEVMGWSVRTPPWGRPGPPWPRYNPEGGYLAREQAGRTERWHPSTDIAAAWEVLQKLDDDFGAVLSRPGPWHCKRQWTVTLMPESGSTTKVTADTAPLAICEAALSTVKEKA